VTLISVKLTIRELDLLTTLASDQLFRREFIEPKTPGHRSNPGEIDLGRVLVARLRTLLERDTVRKSNAV